MAKKFFIVSSVLLILAAFEGVCRGGESGFVLKRHEFSVSGGFFQRMYMNTPQLNTDNTAFLPTDYLLSMVGVSKDEKEKMTGTWRLAYAYNFSRLFALELSLNYEGYRDNFYNAETGSKTETYYGDRFGLMAALRVSWKNSRIVRVYSSAGVGVSWLSSGGNYRPSGGPKVSYDGQTDVDWQVVPVGMTIGRGIYAIVELGVGTVFVGGRFGVGYRF